MKRFAFEGSEMARVLLLVSQQEHDELMPLAGGRGDHGHGHHRGAPAAGRAFVCKTCDRVFPSFQALGGHRASHKKPRLDGDGGDLAKPKLHGCSVCGLEFAVGQALGGHMRRHRAMAGASGMAPAAIVVDKNKPGGGDVVVDDDVVGAGSGGIVKRELYWLDLNHPPCNDGGSVDGGGDCGRDAAAAGHGLITFHQFLDTGAMAVDCVGY